MQTEAKEPEFHAWGVGLMREIDVRLLAAVEGDSPVVTELARHVPQAGGKRFRPLLVIGAAGLAYAAGSEPDRETVVKAALTVELTHVASLYHDDVMDESGQRRGVETVNKRWRNSLAIMAGDFLFARASTICAHLGLDYVAWQASTFARLVQGQIAELVGPAPGTDPLAHHRAVIADKTASLIATSARFGGMAAGLDASMLAALTTYGEEVGMAFQLADDLIDITSEEAGKDPGADLREGILTLAPLLIIAAGRPEDAELVEWFRRPVPPAALPHVLALLRAHPVITDVRAEIDQHRAKARAALDPLPEGPAKDNLRSLCDAAVTRTF